MNKDLILKRGDRITYSLDSDIEDIHILYVDGCDGKSIKSFEQDDGKVLKVERQVKYETIYEYKEILDKEEKEYLRNVIKPFRDRVTYIFKCCDSSELSYIFIKMKNKENIKLPFFKRNTMYKGMQPNRSYTLEELGL